MEGLLSSNIQPSLFRYKIGSFSLFSASPIERFESCEFGAHDNKWKLSFYPNGNKEKGGKNHISLYLMLANSSSFEEDILVSFRLVAFDHIREEYFTAQEVSRFSSKKSESGFHKFLTLDLFNDPSNGFLVDDTCMFGVEVFSVLSVGVGHCLSGNQNQLPVTHRWKVEGFSKLENKSYSDTFTAGGHKWKMLLFPKGNDDAKGEFLSLYLELANPEKIETGKKVDLEFKLRLVDQAGNEHWEKIYRLGAFDNVTKDLGFTYFILLCDFKKNSTGYLVKDTCILEAEIIAVTD